MYAINCFKRFLHTEERRRKKKKRRHERYGQSGFYVRLCEYSIEMIFIRFYVTIITSLVKRSLTAIEMEKWQKIDGRSKRRKRYLFSLK